jgi:hypothetical protein
MTTGRYFGSRHPWIHQAWASGDRVQVSHPHRDTGRAYPKMATNPVPGTKEGPGGQAVPSPFTHYTPPLCSARQVIRHLA